jgi:hypothetical protein
MKAKDILNFVDLRRGTVDVPEWGTVLTVQELGLEQGLAVYKMAQSLDGDKVLMKAADIAQIVAWSVIDPNTGNLVFSNADVPKLAKKNRAALIRIYQAITSLSGEEAEKN